MSVNAFSYELKSFFSALNLIQLQLFDFFKFCIPRIKGYQRFCFCPTFYIPRMKGCLTFYIPRMKGCLRLFHCLKFSIPKITGCLRLYHCSIICTSRGRRCIYGFSTTLQFVPLFFEFCTSSSKAYL